METPYDWITVALFAGLIVLFLQRSMADEPSDRMIDYLPPALGCAIGNYLGNEGMHIPAILVIAAVPVYVWFKLKPLAP